MKILNREENKRFYIHNNHLFYYNHQCMMYLGEEPPTQYWEAEPIKMYETGILYTKHYGYEKVSQMIFFGNDGKELFSIYPEKQPFDIHLYKSKADNLNALVFNTGVLVSQRNVDNQCKYMFYFYDKTTLTSYNFEELISKVKLLSASKDEQTLILNQLENNSKDL